VFALPIRLARPDLAMQHLRKVLALTDDPFLIYLTLYFAGRAQEAHGTVRPRKGYFGR